MATAYWCVRHGHKIVVTQSNGVHRQLVFSTSSPLINASFTPYAALSGMYESTKQNALFYFTFNDIAPKSRIRVITWFLIGHKMVAKEDWEIINMASIQLPRRL